MKSVIAKAVTVLLLLVTPLLAAAQAFPAKPVRLIVPYPPGGVADSLARALAQGIRKLWAQQIVVENRPGGNTIIGAELLARSAPDGYTMLMSDRAPLVLNPLLYRKLPYDSVKDFAPVMTLAQVSHVLTANRDLPVKSLQDLIALAKAKPGEINYGSLGLGSITHLDTEAFSAQAGIKLTHVPYKGLAEVMPALMGGQIQIAVSGVSFAAPLLRDGRIKVLAVGSTRRSSVMPDIPTFAELGFAGIEWRTWFGLMVPGSTPRAIIEKIATDMGSVITDKEFSDKYLVSLGLELLNQGPEEFSRVINADLAKYKVYIETLNIKLD